MDNPDLTSTKGSYTINQFGYALEAELRLVDDKLGIYFDHGLATGDSDVEGLSTDASTDRRRRPTSSPSTAATARSARSASTRRITST